MTKLNEHKFGKEFEQEMQDLYCKTVLSGMSNYIDTRQMSNYRKWRDNRIKRYDKYATSDTYKTDNTGNPIKTERMIKENTESLEQLQSVIKKDHAQTTPIKNGSFECRFGTFSMQIQEVGDDIVCTINVLKTVTVPQLKDVRNVLVDVYSNRKNYTYPKLVVAATSHYLRDVLNSPKDFKAVFADYIVETTLESKKITTEEAELRQLFINQCIGIGGYIDGRQEHLYKKWKQNRIANFGIERLSDATLLTNIDGSTFGASSKTTLENHIRKTIKENVKNELIAGYREYMAAVELLGDKGLSRDLEALHKTILSTI
jgi:hypothetical protein